MQNRKTAGENLLDILNTETFVTILADMQGQEKPKCKHTEAYKENRADILKSYQFFDTMPWMTEYCRQHLKAAMATLIERANA